MGVVVRRWPALGCDHLERKRSYATWGRSRLISLTVILLGVGLRNGGREWVGEQNILLILPSNTDKTL